MCDDLDLATIYIMNMRTVMEEKFTMEKLKKLLSSKIFFP